MICLAPFAVTWAAVLPIAGGREIEIAQITDIIGRAAFLAAMLLLWIIALTITLPSEARAAMIGVGVIMIWSMLTVALHHTGWVSAISPMHFILKDFQQPLLTELTVNSVIAIGLIDISQRAAGHSETLAG